LTSNVTAKPIIWKVQSNKPAGGVLFTIEQQLAEEIAFATKGELLLIVKPEGGFIGIRESFNGLRKGDINAMFMTPQYWGGADPIFTILGDLVAAWNSPEQYRRWLSEQNGIRYLENAYDKFGLKLISYTIAPAESIVSKVPIASIDDFKGKVIRSPPGMISDFFSALGARPRNITVAKISNALEKGQISMADFSNLVHNHHLNQYEIAKYTNYPGFHSMPLYDFVVRKAAWNALKSEHKLAVKKVMAKWDSVIYNSTHFQLEEVLKTIKKDGVTVHRWDESEIRAARRLAVNVWDNYGRKNHTAKRIIVELKLWLKVIGNI
jgi:TRAP-type C4-dicarboxylate transport system substrate-binding protein